MSEERFNRIEQKLDVVAADVAVLKTDVAVLKTDVAVLKTDVSALKAGVAGNSASIAELRQHMGVLHEDVVDRIRAVAEDDSLRREMQAGFAELRTLLKDHVVVGDATDRHFGQRLNEHERRIRTLEGQ